MTTLEVIAAAPGSPALLVAPHGGRRPPRSEVELPRPRKVNDLGTAELTRELAAATGAAALVNATADRNAVDLNRVSAVRSLAPDFLERLVAAVRERIADAGRAEVFFVHGWNAIQPCCDVGIGARFDGERLSAVANGRATVPPAFLPRLRAFAADAAGRGLRVVFGDRYPGASGENVLQLFSPRFAGDPDPLVRELAETAAGGRLAAVQLELALPLRWPGPRRSALLEAAARLVRGAAGSETWRSPPRAARAPAERVALEGHDGASGIGFFAGIDRMPTGRRIGRLLFSVGASRLVLFTGEDPFADDAGLSCGDLRWTELGPGRARLEYRGPALRFPRTDPFLDLEAGLDEATLGDLEAEFEWRAWSPAPEGALAVGEVHARIRHPDLAARLDGVATLRRGGEPARGAWHEHRELRCPLGSRSFLAVTSSLSPLERVAGTVVRDGRAEPVLNGRVEVHVAADRMSPDALRVEVATRSGPLRVHGRVTSAVPVLRPTADGTVLSFFGLARYGRGEDGGFGTFELARRTAAPPVSQEEEE